MVWKLCSEGCSKALKSNPSCHAWKTPLNLLKSKSYKCVILRNWRVNVFFGSKCRVACFYDPWEKTLKSTSWNPVSGEQFGRIGSGPTSGNVSDWKVTPMVASHAADVIPQSDGAGGLLHSADWVKGCHTSSVLHRTSFITVLLPAQRDWTNVIPRLGARIRAN